MSQDQDYIRQALEASIPGHAPNVSNTKRVERPEENHTQIEHIPEQDEIIEQMRCNLCGLIPAPPNSLVCEVGHMICDTCFKRLPTNSCPKEVGADAAEACSSRLFRQRSQLFAYIYYNSYHRCAFFDMGCRRLPIGNGLDAHWRHCIYRPALQCPMSDCDLGPFWFANYSDHLKSEHKILPFNINEVHLIQISLDRINKGIGFNGDSYRWVCAIFPTSTIDFFLMAEEYFGGISIWMTTGPPNGQKFEQELDNYDYNVTVLASEEADDPDDVLRWQGQIQPFSNDFTNALKDGTSLTISKATFIKKFMYQVGPDYFWQIHIQLHQIERETECFSASEPEPETTTESPTPTTSTGVPGHLRRPGRKVFTEKPMTRTEQ